MCTLKHPNEASADWSADWLADQATGWPALREMLDRLMTGEPARATTLAATVGASRSAMYDVAIIEDAREPCVHNKRDGSWLLLRVTPACHRRAFSF